MKKQLIVRLKSGLELTFVSNEVSPASISAAFCFNRSEGDFTVQSQCKRVLFIPSPIPFQLSEIESIRLSKKSKP
jgi:hypothetical protein